MDLQTLYKAILESLHVPVDNDGLLSMSFGGQLFPLTSEGSRLALPTAERLRSGEWGGLVAFHPLSENLLRGESPILKKLKGIMTLRLHMVLTELLQQFTAIGADTAKHATLSPKAQELLSHIPDVDEKSCTAMEKILEAANPDGPNRLLSMYLKRGGMFKGTRFSWLAVVAFPFMEQFEGDDRKVYGVDLRVRDYAAFDSLFRYILPDAGDLEAYSSGSQSLIAPKFSALLQAYLKVAKQLNTIIKLHWDQLENPEYLQFNLDWEESARDMSSYSGMIPSLAGNEGELLDTDATRLTDGEHRPTPSILQPTAPKVNATPVPISPAPVAATPFNNSPQHTAPAPPDRKAGKGVDFNAVMLARQHPAPAAYGAPIQQAWPVHQQPGQLPPGASYYRGILVDAYGRPIDQNGYVLGPPIAPMTQAPAPVASPDWVIQSQPAAGGYQNPAYTANVGGYGAAAWGNNTV